MYLIDNQSRFSVYEQIVNQVEKYVLNGVLVADQQMPSVRSLSIDLNVNPNTVQKAYTELERKKIIYTVKGRGTFISDQALKIIKELKKQHLIDLEPMIYELALAEIPIKEVFSLVETIYRRVKK